MAYSRPSGPSRQPEPLEPPIGFLESMRESYSLGVNDNMMPQINLPVSSPLPLNRSQYDMNTSNNISARGFDRYSMNNSYTRNNDHRLSSTLDHSPYTVKSPDSPLPLSPVNAGQATLGKSQWSSDQNYNKQSDQWSPAPLNSTRNDTTSNDRYSSNTTYTQIIERSPPTNNSGKSYEPWTPTSSFTKTSNKTTSSTSASDIQMIKSANKSSGVTTNWCSPRCKLGVLGFVIGLLAVGIGVAVVLVLWLRR
ncbi:unnamed protein product [Adineta ricciae]|uniref:Uncharacterized protein n=1 Tax=Adineta ricciae TaxID=249248 RepID=A0A814F1J2_ADIRI|nr:unnamed protein product [Adineta ricciae]CAF0975402.1 unnamed protein product [Adineta ricciae]